MFLLPIEHIFLLSTHLYYREKVRQSVCLYQLCIIYAIYGVNILYQASDYIKTKVRYSYLLFDVLKTLCSVPTHMIHQSLFFSFWYKPDNFSRSCNVSKILNGPQIICIEQFTR
ncbi:hypothetical protein HanIR_Chr14g0672951 [Helianthus annuus]|nr:hypothetical protein HanIR_Chr14g0672951 [Helianthus annuus]